MDQLKHYFIVFILAGLYFCFNRLTDANIFIIMYGVTSIYFAVCTYTGFFKISIKNNFECMFLALLIAKCNYFKL